MQSSLLLNTQHKSLAIASEELEIPPTVVVWCTSWDQPELRGRSSGPSSSGSICPLTWAPGSPPPPLCSPKTPSPQPPGTPHFRHHNHHRHQPLLHQLPPQEHPVPPKKTNGHCRKFSEAVIDNACGEFVLLSQVDGANNTPHERPGR